jgi:hypothetical protein
MIFRWWRAYQRSLDRWLLWPACKANTPNLETACGIMLMHTRIDPAWSDVSDDEAVEIIAGWAAMDEQQDSAQSAGRNDSK